jgi:hypothetical protein
VFIYTELDATDYVSSEGVGSRSFQEHRQQLQVLSRSPIRRSHQYCYRMCRVHRSAYRTFRNLKNNTVYHKHSTVKHITSYAYVHGTYMLNIKYLNDMFRAHSPIFRPLYLYIPVHNFVHTNLPAICYIWAIIRLTICATNTAFNLIVCAHCLCVNPTSAIGLY